MFATRSLPPATLWAQDAGPFTFAGTGQSFASLQDAVDAIGGGRGTIHIAPGRYSDCAVQEAGHVAFFLGEEDKARGYWMRSAGNDPNGSVGKAAAKAVEMLGVTPVVKTETQTPK